MSMLRLALGGFLLLAGLGVWPAPAARAAGGRLVLVGAVDPEPDPARAAWLSYFRQVARTGDLRLEVGGAASLQLKSRRGTVSVLSPLAGRLLEQAGKDDVKTLANAVRAGAAVLVFGSAASRLPDSPAFSDLLGRGEIPPRAAGDLLPVAIPDQRRFITECIPHLVFRRTRLTAFGSPPHRALATTPAADARPAKRRFVPVAWIRKLGRGAVVTVALQPERAVAVSTLLRTADAPPVLKASVAARECAILAVILARSAQWLAAARGRVWLPRAMPLAARALDDRPALFPSRKGFFRGRQTARTMSYLGSDWLWRKDREDSEKPEELLDSLAIRPGSVVADVGCGSGYFTVRLAKRVGPRGKVLAVDVQKEMLDLLKTELGKRRITNVEPILATGDDPSLPGESVDLAVMVDVYHEIDDPSKVLDGIRRALKPGAAAVAGRATTGPAGGRLVLVEYRGEDPAVPIKPLHRTSEEQILAELHAAGFEHVETKRFLPLQHVLVFRARDKKGD